ncbi:MAG: ATP-dependent 6-phosphofructokinase [Mycoplasmataceae bacterium]|jgi:6-phosphofructokinase 1|nr:ATP-dependent 6-phosphofructokinase [Mycoplasmataceae bacterium]
MRIGILASGGNSPGMNNAIITLVKKASVSKIDTLLIRDGYKGLLANDFIKPDIRYLDKFVTTSNVVIGSARSKDFYKIECKKKAQTILKKRRVDVLVVIGGDGSYKGAAGLAKLGQKVMGLPGTIDNDVSSTDVTIGFATCLNTIVVALDAIRDSFESHAGICFVEVMGRGFSDLAVTAGIATQAEAIITPENILSVEDFIEIANLTKKNGKRSCLFVVTEGIYGRNGLLTLNDIANEVEQVTSRSTRVNVIGYSQRGGTPTASDRFLAATMANHCIECLLQKRFNRVIVQKSGEILDVDINEAIALPHKRNNTKCAKIYELIDRV